MSVKKCSRWDCSKIMCDRIILQNSRYICDACWSELLTFKASWPQDGMNRQRVEGLIRDFMDDTTPGQFMPLDAKGVDDEFDRLTREAESMKQ